MSDSNEKNGNSRLPTHQMLSRTLVLILVCGILAFIVLLAKLFQLQIVQHRDLETAAISQQVGESISSPRRGSIYDRNGKILAMSADCETIFISPAEIVIYDEDPVFIAKNLSEILGVDYGKILEMTANTESWYQIVARRVDDELAEEVRAFRRENNLKGIKFESDSRRYYPYGSLACHVIGFVGNDQTGLSGIELAYDSVLSGSAGRIVRAKNAYGEDILYSDYENVRETEDGFNVVLTIDSTIQYYMEKYLQQAVEDYDVQDGAAAICMNVNTGEILGMVSLNNFDLNHYEIVADSVYEEMEATTDDTVRASLLSNAQQKQWRNKAVQDAYEPGSTFKIITLAMALEEGTSTMNSSYYCGGYLEVTGDEPDEGRHCWKTAGHGMQTLTECMQHSCNVALIQMGLEIGAERFYDYVDAFGFNETTGIELGGESGSIWWDRDYFCASYNKTQLAAASFGQTFTITPLQLIRAVSACANGGYLMEPYLVKEVRDSDGNPVSKNEPVILRQVVSEETSREVCQILEQVVSDKVEGTGKNAYVAGYRIGGKTGTSTDTVIEARSGRKQYIVSFIGIAPVDDPEICILVLLDNPSDDSGIYVSGGNMGAPTVGNMMADILPYLGVEAVYSDEEYAAMDKTVPNLEGLTLDEAKSLLEGRGLGWRALGAGNTVSTQLPAPNSVIAADSQVILYADTEPSGDLEEMPDLTGLPYSIARQRLGYYGLFISTDSHQLEDSETIVVKSQSVAPGEEVAHGTVINVTLVNMDSSLNGRY